MALEAHFANEQEYGYIYRCHAVFESWGEKKLYLSFTVNELSAETSFFSFFFFACIFTFFKKSTAVIINGLYYVWSFLMDFH